MWNDELQLIERHPWACVGFGLGVTTVLFLPIVNLIFRPVLVVGAAHLRNGLDHADRQAEALNQGSQNEPPPTAFPTGDTSPSD